VLYTGGDNLFGESYWCETTIPAYENLLGFRYVYDPRKDYYINGFGVLTTPSIE